MKPLDVATIPCDIICIFWGADFLTTFTEFTLPSLLAPGNLPNWPHAATSVFVIYTPQQEWTQLQQHPVMALIQRYVGVCWYPIVVPEYLHTAAPSAKYYFKTTLNAQALDRAAHHHRAWLQIIPDMVYGAGALQTLDQLIAAGKDVILHIGPRLSNACQTVLSHRCHNHILDLSPAVMTQLMLQYLHPEYQGYFWLAPDFTGVSPSVVFYWQNKTTLVARSYTPEPLFLRYPRSPKEKLNTTLDGGYMELYDDLLIQGQAERMAMTGGSELCAFSISPPTSLTVDWLIALPYGYRPTLSFIYLQGWLSQSLFYDWAFDQRISWQIDDPSLAENLQLYQESLPRAPWMAPVILRHLTRLAKQDGWEHILQVWNTGFVQKVLTSLTDPKLFFWADLVAQAIYRCGSWHEYTHFHTLYGSLLEKAPYFLTPCRPNYAAYLPYPQTIDLYPTGWPGFETLTHSPLTIVWLDEHRFSDAESLTCFQTDETLLWLNLFGTSVEDTVHEAYLHQYPQRVWHCLSLPTALPDLLADLLYRATTLFIPITLRLICHEQVILATLYQKTIYWI